MAQLHSHWVNQHQKAHRQSTALGLSVQWKTTRALTGTMAVNRENSDSALHQPQAADAMCGHLHAEQETRQPSLTVMQMACVAAD
jgi:hypothetical protein